MRSISDYFDYVQSLYDSSRKNQSRATERLALSDAAGRVLSSPAVAEMAVPPFSNSAMDGFAIRREDLPSDATTGSGPWTFPVSGDVAAGATPELPPVGHAQRIMTGAPVPEDADLLIIPVEHTNIPIGPHELPKEIEISEFHPDRDHVRKAGSNVTPGEEVAPAGTPLDAGTIAALLSTGVSAVEVFVSLKVGVITTGDEVIDVAEEGKDSLRAGQIPDSNGPMVAHLVGTGEPGLKVTRHRVKDTPEAFRELLNELAETHDLILTTGGVSAGAFDIVREVADHPEDSAENTSMWFGPINMKPGKPQGAGLWHGTPLVCMPGNPVSGWASFQMFIAPLLHALKGLGRTGDVLSRPIIRATAVGDFPHGKNRTLIVPARINYSGKSPQVTAFSNTKFGSHFVGSLVDLNGLVMVDADKPAPQDGDTVEVALI